MTVLETTNIFQKIAISTGLPSLAVEAGFLLIVMLLISVVILVVLAILKIKKEMLKLSKTATYIANLLRQEAADRKVSMGYYEFKPDEWMEGTRHLVVEMLQQGKSYNEILEKVDVTKAYISEVELWAKKEGFIQVEH